jgi:hypothetical protein
MQLSINSPPGTMSYSSWLNAMEWRDSLPIVRRSHLDRPPANRPLRL